MKFSRAMQAAMAMTLVNISFDHSQMEINCAADCGRPNEYALLLIKYKGSVGIFLSEPHCDDSGNSKI